MKLFRESITGLLAAISLTASAIAAEAPDDAWRPRLHFTAASGWINDPNGLFRVGGEWHAQYQYLYPRNWGHASSSDLLHWRELPPSLVPDATGECWSGCAVRDGGNSSGLFPKGAPGGLVDIYCSRTKSAQHISLAYSLNEGLTWQRPPGNPVLTSDSPDFRDPKAWWDASHGRWGMVVTAGRRLEFYTSPDLRTWTRSGEFAPALEPVFVLECPDLFPLPLEGGTGEKWVLVTSLLDSTIFKEKRMGLCQSRYFVGEWDGSTFHAEAGTDAPLWLSQGPDDYAGITWPRDPASGRTLLISWMNHWGYASKLKTGAWQGCLSLPRELTLRTSENGPRLLQQPARELWQLPAHTTEASFRQLSASDGRKLLGTATTAAIRTTLQPSRDCVIEWELFASANARTVVGYDAARSVLYFDRRDSGSPGWSADFQLRREVPISLTADAALDLDIIIDRSTVEVFADHGAAVLSGLTFPSPESREIAVQVVKGTATFSRMEVREFEK